MPSRVSEWVSPVQYLLVACLALPLLLAPSTVSAAIELDTAQVRDVPGDDGTSLLVTFSLRGVTDELATRADVVVDSGGEVYKPSQVKPQRLTTISTQADLPEYFGWEPEHPDWYVMTLSRYYVLDDDGEQEPVELEAGESYTLGLQVVDPDGSEQLFENIGSAAPLEQWFNPSLANNLIICVIFAFIIMAFIMAARKNPNLFIRRINGLEAVDDAIGRATEMGRPVLQVNGLDPLSTLSTIAAVNILGRIARRVANYDSELLVPCFDPVVMTVSQEVVRTAYMEAGRPDAYREDSIYFVTDQQFSYVATVCGIMVREKPAANFLLGYFYAESLMLAETGFMTGAIQIAGTDALAQLPFFITTCDYTLIGEELYAASAYLSREPMLLGSLKGQDVGKAFVMVVILIGTILATIILLQGGDGLDWISRALTPLQ